jgi:hypothetical protein
VSDLSERSFQNAYYDLEAITLLAEAARTESICNAEGIVLQARRPLPPEVAAEAQDLRRRAGRIGSRAGQPILSGGLRKRLEDYFDADAAISREAGLPH